MDTRSLIKALGGPSKVAVRLGQQVSTVSMWSARDSIPAEFHVQVWRIAMELNVAWQPPGTDGLALVQGQAA